jgi:O-antigen/teichoic acid export membrane protein
MTAPSERVNDGSAHPATASTPEPAGAAIPAARTTARRAASDVVLQIGARGLNALLGVAVTIALVRGLGARGFGDWSTLLSILTIVGYLGTLGLNDVALRYAALDPEHESMWISAVVALQLIISVPVTLVTIAVGVGLTHGSSKIAAVLLACTCLFTALGSVRVVFQLRVRNSWTAGFELLNGILWAIAVLSIAAIGGGIVPFAVAFLGTTAIVNVAQFALARRQVHFGVSGQRSAIRQLIVVGVPFAIASLLYLAYTQVDQVLVFELAGARQAGLYGAANRMLDRALVIPASILATLFPMIAGAFREDIVRMRGLIQTAAEVLLTATVPFVCLVAVIARPLMTLMFGPQFAEAGDALTVFMIVFAASGFSFIAGDLVIVLGIQRRYIFYALAGLVVNVGLNVVLIPPYGFLAAAWVSLVTEVVVIGLALHTCLSLIDLRLRFGRIIRILLTSGVGGLVALGAKELGWALVPIGIAWLIGTALGWLVLRPWTREELRAVVRGRGG